MFPQGTFPNIPKGRVSTDDYVPIRGCILEYGNGYVDGIRSQLKIRVECLER